MTIRLYGFRAKEWSGTTGLDSGLNPLNPPQTAMTTTKTPAMLKKEWLAGYMNECAV